MKTALEKGELYTTCTCIPAPEDQVGVLEDRAQVWDPGDSRGVPGPERMKGSRAEYSQEEKSWCKRNFLTILDP